MWVASYINNKKSMNQLKAGAILNYVVIILSTLVGLLYTPYMLRMMGQSEYGLYSLVASVIAYLTVLDLGLGNAIVRYTSKFRAEGKVKEQYEMFGMFLILYLFIGIIAFCTGLGLYFNIETMFGDTMSTAEIERARVMMLIMVFNLAYTFPMSIFGSIMTAYERFIFPKIINIIRIILNTLIMIVLLKLGYKALAMVVLLTVFNVVSLFINFLYCKFNLKIKLHFGKFKWDFLKEVAIYSFWIFLNAIMDRVYWSTGQFILGAVAGTTAIAVFAVAIHLESLYLQFSTAISNVFLPKVTSMVTLNANDKQLSDLFITTGRVQNIIMVTILLGFIVFGKYFVRLWAGYDYEEAYLMTILFFVSLYIPLIQNLGITILQARNQMKFRSLLYIVIAICTLGFQYCFALWWGALGCTIAVACALFLGQGIIMNVYYKRKQKISINAFWCEIFKMDIVPIAISVVFYFVVKTVAITTWFQLVMWIAIFMCVYTPAFYKFSMNASEKKLIVKPFLKMIRR